MYLTDEVNSYIALLKSKPYYADKYVIAAYPYAYSPTRLDRPLIAVSPGGIEAKCAGIGSDTYCATYGIRVDVFVPQSSGTPCVSDVITKIVDDAKELCPIAYTSSEITAENSISCFKSRIMFKHSGTV
ncbi:MAG: hypothetical protein IJR60_05040 [Eubacterium sp.]|nr:hypothetical protein [Eubacterium sp.]